MLLGYGPEFVRGLRVTCNLATQRTNMIRLVAKTNVLKVAVIGMGNRVSHMLRLMCEADPDIRIAAAADPVGEQLVRRRMDEWKIPHADETHVFDDAEELLRHAGDFDGL